MSLCAIPQRCTRASVLVRLIELPLHLRYISAVFCARFQHLLVHLRIFWLECRVTEKRWTSSHLRARIYRGCAGAHTTADHSFICTDTLDNSHLRVAPSCSHTMNKTALSDTHGRDVHTSLETASLSFLTYLTVVMATSRPRQSMQCSS